MGFIARQSGHTLATSIITKFGLGLLIDVFISRSLGAEGKGHYFQFVTTILLLTSVFGFGIVNGNILLGASQKLSYPKLIRLSFFFAVAASLLAAAVLLAGFDSSWIGYILPNRKFNTNTLLLLCALPLVFFNLFLTGVVQAKGDIVFNNQITLISQTAVTVMLGVCFLTGVMTPNVAIASFVGSILISLIMLVTAYRGEIRSAIIIPTTFAEAGMLLGSSAAIYLGTVVYMLNLRLDTYFVSYYGGKSDLGIYSIAIRVAESIWLVSQSMGGALLPAVVSGNPTAASVTAKLAMLAFVVSLVLAVSAAVLGQFAIVFLFSERFAAAALPMLYLLPGAVCLSLTNVFSIYIVGRGYSWWHTANLAAALVVTIGLDLWLIPALGIRGAAVASSVAYTLTAVVSTVTFFKLSAFSPGDVPGLFVSMQREVVHGIQRTLHGVGRTLRGRV
ncbi:MAG: polysaccharide biosynthesis C-terminal domain-containing protein [Rhizobacter sp.]|nr:polysaccharide biosynthesis C-terminal domain-containing protein [Chlorobiales bacterium]